MGVSKAFARVRAALAVGGMALCYSYSVPAQADTVVVQPDEVETTWEGFGANLSWWANAIGGTPYEDQYINLFFGLDEVTLPPRDNPGKETDFPGAKLPGLGLTIARYNIGGGGRPEDSQWLDQKELPPPPNLTWHKDIDGFMRDWYQRDRPMWDSSVSSQIDDATGKAVSNWDWSRDARQRSVLEKLPIKGVEIELFSTAPMWWMTCEKTSAGGTLAPWNLQNYAKYLAHVVKHFVTDLHFRVNSIAPFNEPTGAGWISGKSPYDGCDTEFFQELQRYENLTKHYTETSPTLQEKEDNRERLNKAFRERKLGWNYGWWQHGPDLTWGWDNGKWGKIIAYSGEEGKEFNISLAPKQEGVNLSTGAQAQMIPILRKELDALGLSNILIAASDENTMEQGVDTYRGLQAHGVDGLIDKVNVHGYAGLNPWRQNAMRAKLRETVGDKPVWVTEYGDGNDGSGRELAISIMSDINHLRPSAWLYWQPVEPDSFWGMMNGKYLTAADEHAPDRGAPTWVYDKYYTFAHFTRFLRPRSRILGDGDDRTIAGYDDYKKKLVLITVNAQTKLNPADWHKPDSWLKPSVDRPITYDLTKFGATNGFANVTVSKFDTPTIFQTLPIPLENGKLSITIPADSMVSVEIDNVELPPLRQLTTIRSSGTQNCLSKTGGSAMAAEQLVSKTCSQSDSTQLFRLTGSDQFYNIVNSEGTKCLNISEESQAAGAHAILWPCRGSSINSHERFKLKRQGSGTALVSSHSGKCVTLKEGSLTQQDCDGSPEQTWIIPVPQQPIQSIGSGFCLTSLNGFAKQKECSGKRDQEWIISTVPAHAVQGIFPAVSNEVNVQSAYTGLCLTVDEKNNSEVKQSACIEGNMSQQFDRIPYRGGYLFLTQGYTTCLGSSRIEGSAMMRENCKIGPFQTWR